MSVGHNGVDPVVLKRWTGEILKVHQRLEEAKMEHMRVCKEIREPLNDYYESAANAGLGKKPFKAHIKAELAKIKYDRALSAALPEDDDDRLVYERLRSIAEAGDLFDAAVKSHDDGAGAERTDVRPRHLREKESDRKARENGEKIMTGIKPLIGLPGADAAEA